jgi:hypothetical protein
MDLLQILILNSQKNLHPCRPRQVLHPTTPAPMMKAILSRSTSNNLSSDDKCNQDEKSDDIASAEDCKTKNLDGLEINLERCHEPNIDNLPVDKNAAQIVQ